MGEAGVWDGLGGKGHDVNHNSILSERSMCKRMTAVIQRVGGR
jgi:hypothetical protein